MAKSTPKANATPPTTRLPPPSEPAVAHARLKLRAAQVPSLPPLPRLPSLPGLHKTASASSVDNAFVGVGGSVLYAQVRYELFKRGWVHEDTPEEVERLLLDLLLAPSILRDIVISYKLPVHVSSSLGRSPTSQDYTNSLNAYIAALARRHDSDRIIGQFIMSILGDERITTSVASVERRFACMLRKDGVEREDDGAAVAEIGGGGVDEERRGVAMVDMEVQCDLEVSEGALNGREGSLARDSIVPEDLPPLPAVSRVNAEISAMEEQERAETEAARALEDEIKLTEAQIRRQEAINRRIALEQKQRAVTEHLRILEENGKRDSAALDLSTAPTPRRVPSEPLDYDSHAYKDSAMFEVNPGSGIFLIDSSSVVPIPSCPATPDTGLAPALAFDATPPADLHHVYMPWLLQEQLSRPPIASTSAIPYGDDSADAGPAVGAYYGSSHVNTSISTVDASSGEPAPRNEARFASPYVLGPHNIFGPGNPDPRFPTPEYATPETSSEGTTQVVSTTPPYSPNITPEDFPVPTGDSTHSASVSADPPAIIIGEQLTSPEPSTAKAQQTLDPYAPPHASLIRSIAPSPALLQDYELKREEPDDSALLALLQDANGSASRRKRRKKDE